MKIKINGLKKGVVYGNRDTLDVSSVSMDSEHKYAVAEVFRNELYIAVKIIAYENDILIWEYVDHYSDSDDCVMLMKYYVDWECIKYGFCKLILWAPEMAAKWNGSFEKTVKRFYFDWELYKRSYEEKHGVPCPKRNPIEV